MAAAPPLFDRACVRQRRERAVGHFSGHDFLKSEATARLSERLLDIARPLPKVLELGCHTGAWNFPADTLVRCDLAEGMVRRAEGLRCVADEEAMPFAPASMDAIVSSMAAHSVNDLPGMLAQSRRILKPDGLLLMNFPGGNTLKELREVLTEAEMALLGGVHPHVAPFVEVKDAGALLQRAGFALPVADTETLEIHYPSLIALLHDIRGMGETSALMRRARILRRDVLAHAEALYRERYTGQDGRLIATVELITLTGWAPADTQPRPLKRGTGQVSLTDVFRD